MRTWPTHAPPPAQLGFTEPRIVVWGRGDAAILLDFFPDFPMGLESSLRQSGPEVKSMDTSQMAPGSEMGQLCDLGQGVGTL